MSLQLQIEKESEKFKDVVQGYFTDSYRNLTYKGVMGYEWISEHCRNAEFVAKIDDDAFINFFKLFEEMQYLKDKKRYILCNKINKGTMRIRKKTSKWYVQEDEFIKKCRYIHIHIVVDLPYLYPQTWYQCYTMPPSDRHFSGWTIFIFLCSFRPEFPVLYSKILEHT
jgi:hypothetical protein